MTQFVVQEEFSRYKFTRGLIDSSGRLFASEREPLRFRDDPDNLLHTTKTGERWWHIAHRFYREVSDNAGLLYWVVCDYQVPPVLDPTLAIPEGTIVVAPSQNVVLNEIIAFVVDRFQ